MGFVAARPAVTSLRLTLAESEVGTTLTIRDERFGTLGGDSPEAGWRMVFDDGLRAYIEAQGVPD